ncbi:MAG TPA: fibronectin type III domain-containing protein, partial [Actinoplanes sp.]|nr:fibronectin type III domain-containing protein [Actinoplanes sp.]
MGHVPPPIAELTARAQTLTSAGDLVGARKVLAPVLEPSDTDPQHASPDLAVAAALHARILIALGEPHAARIWAGYAHAAEEHLHGPHDERTINAAATHAAVLARIGNHGQAAQLYHDLVLELTALDGRESQRVLAAEADLATAEHAAGQCTAARSRLAEVWARHRRVYGDPAPAGIKMLARLGAMDRECGRHTESRKHLDLAQELCARHLPGDHPLAAQIAKLAAAPASGRHTCGRVRQSAGPEPDAPGAHAAARRSTPSPDEPAPGVYAVPPRSASAQHEPAAQQ